MNEELLSIIKDIVEQNINDRQKKVDVYRALCNNWWYKVSYPLNIIGFFKKMYHLFRVPKLTENKNSCSWRYAGSLVAKFEKAPLRDVSDFNEFDKKMINQHPEDDMWQYEYMEYYCSGGEGRVEKWIKDIMKKKGWYHTDVC